MQECGIFLAGIVTGKPDGGKILNPEIKECQQIKNNRRTPLITIADCGVFRQYFASPLSVVGLFSNILLHHC
jgi:hypothetical protein